MAAPDIVREHAFERALPNSSEAERAILGAVLLDNGLISQAIEHLRPEDFYVPSHRRIFVAMIALFERGAEVTRDVIVVGGGNAALCAAISASEIKEKILVLERAPEDESGGNSRFTAGLLRVVYNGVDDLRQVIELSDDEVARSDFGTYTEEQFLDDMARLTEYRRLYSDLVTNYEQVRLAEAQTSTNVVVSEEAAIPSIPISPKPTRNTLLAVLAGLLLAGLLSDTLILSSPTTTDRDKRAAERLARWAFTRSGPLAGETIPSYGNQVLMAGSGLAHRSPKEIVSTDVKTYEAGGLHFAIAQVEVTALMQLRAHRVSLTQALDELKNQRGLDFAMLLVTDVVSGTSRLIISSNAPPILDDLPYPPLPDGTRDAEGVVSRKKQLLPVVLGLLEN